MKFYWCRILTEVNQCEGINFDFLLNSKRDNNDQSDFHLKVWMRLFSYSTDKNLNIELIN